MDVWCNAALENVDVYDVPLRLLCCVFILHRSVGFYTDRIRQILFLSLCCPWGMERTTMVSSDEEYVDRHDDFLIACEMAIRFFFAQKDEKNQRSVKKHQDQVTRSILHFIAGGGGDAAFAQSQLLYSDAGVSPIWLSNDFTLPIFAISVLYCSQLLVPLGHRPPVDVTFENSQNALFGIRLKSITSIKNDILFFLLTIGAVRFYLKNEQNMKIIQSRISIYNEVV